MGEIVKDEQEFIFLDENCAGIMSLSRTNMPGVLSLNQYSGGVMLLSAADVRDLGLQLLRVVIEPDAAAYKLMDRLEDEFEVDS